MRSRARRQIEAAWRGEAPVTAALLRGASLPYGLAMRGRNALFDLGLRKQHRLPRPVISVGNLTTGGTGKTPVVAWLAGQLRAAGHVPGVLTRGYAARAGEVDDEVLELRRLLNDDELVEPNPNRIAGATTLLDRRPDVSVLLLDDGFQHRRVARDFDLVLLDATNPFGFGHVLPRGLLREPVNGLRRASAVLVTKCDRADPADALARVPADLPHFTARQRLTVDAPTPFAAFCGLGNPDAFFNALPTQPKLTRTYPDHHRYTAADADDLRGLGLPLVCTRKDAVKLTTFDLPLHVADLTLDVDPGLAELLIKQV
ncbi:MAG: tetraacyldisaccharide 4'-kinase [Planctomycetota bacterium]